MVEKLSKPPFAFILGRLAYIETFLAYTETQIWGETRYFVLGNTPKSAKGKTTNSLNFSF